MTGIGMDVGALAALAVAVSGKYTFDFAISIYLLAMPSVQLFYETCEQIYIHRINEHRATPHFYSLVPERRANINSVRCRHSPSIAHFTKSLIENNYKSYRVKTFIR